MKLLMAVVLVAFSLTTFAKTWTDPNTGITWTYDLSKGKAYLGSKSSTEGAVSRWSTSGTVTIPAKFENCPVVSIGDYAFYGCSGLTSVTIPSGVTNIGERAFLGCSGLTSVTIPSSVTRVGEYAFAYCGGLTSATISSGMTRVENGMFSHCSGLTSMTVPSSVTNIGEYAFAECSGLTSMIISESVTGIGYRAFYYCGKLKTIYVPFGDDVARVRSLLRFEISATLAFVEMIDPSIVIAPDVLPEGKTGELYAERLSVSGGVAPYVWSVRTGNVAVPTDCKESGEVNSFAATGTEQGWKSDNGCWAYDLPFAFPFYGKLYSTIYVSSNGTLAFDGSFNGYSESVSVLKQHVMIAPLWDDLTTGSGDIYVVASDDSVTIRWSGYYRSNSARNVNFSATLHADGTIRLSYGSGNANGGLIGISAGDGMSYLVSPRSQSGSMDNADDIVWRFVPSYPHVALPEGVSLSSDGVLSGTPTAVSSNVFIVAAKDANGNGNLKEYVIVVHGEKVTFDLGKHGKRTGGGELMQEIATGGAAVAPEVTADPGWTFVGWNADFSSVNGAMTVRARYRRDGAYGDGTYSILTNGYTWTFSITDGEAVIGTGEGTVAAISPKPTGDVEIPRTLGGCPVVVIGDSAFYACAGLKSVDIPSSVVSIGPNAFYGCNELATVYVRPGSIERMKELMREAGVSVSAIEFVELVHPPTIEGDEGAVVTGDATSGFEIRPSAGKTEVAVTIPDGVLPDDVTVVVSVNVVAVAPHGAKVRVVNHDVDVTAYLDIPETIERDDGSVVAAQPDSAINLTLAKVKESVVKEALTGEGAVVSLDASNPTITTAATKPGLTYSFREGRTLEAVAAKAEPDDTYDGDGNPWTPKISVSGGDSAFYSLGVGIGK